MTKIPIWLDREEMILLGYQPHLLQIPKDVEKNLITANDSLEMNNPTMIPFPYWLNELEILLRTGVCVNIETIDNPKNMNNPTLPTHHNGKPVFYIPHWLDALESKVCFYDFYPLTRIISKTLIKRIGEDYE